MASSHWHCGEHFFPWHPNFELCNPLLLLSILLAVASMRSWKLRNFPKWSCCWIFYLGNLSYIIVRAVLGINRTFKFDEEKWKCLLRIDEIVYLGTVAQQRSSGMSILFILYFWVLFNIYQLKELNELKFRKDFNKIQYIHLPALICCNYKPCHTMHLRFPCESPFPAGSMCTNSCTWHCKSERPAFRLP